MQSTEILSWILSLATEDLTQKRLDIMSDSIIHFLLDTAESNHVDKLQQLLNKHPQLARLIFNNQERKLSLLHAAISGSAYEAGRLLIELGSDLNLGTTQKGCLGPTPLTMIMKTLLTETEAKKIENAKKFTQELLRAGADPNISGLYPKMPYQRTTPVDLSTLKMEEKPYLQDIFHQIKEVALKLQRRTETLKHIPFQSFSL